MRSVARTKGCGEEEGGRKRDDGGVARLGGCGTWQRLSSAVRVSLQHSARASGWTREEGSPRSFQPLVLPQTTTTPAWLAWGSSTRCWTVPLQPYNTRSPTTAPHSLRVERAPSISSRTTNERWRRLRRPRTRRQSSDTTKTRSPVRLCSLDARRGRTKGPRRFPPLSWPHCPRTPLKARSRGDGTRQIEMKVHNLRTIKKRHVSRAAQARRLEGPSGRGSGDEKGRVVLLAHASWRARTVARGRLDADNVFTRVLCLSHPATVALRTPPSASSDPAFNLRFFAHLAPIRHRSPTCDRLASRPPNSANPQFAFRRRTSRRPRLASSISAHIPSPFIFAAVTPIVPRDPCSAHHQLDAVLAIPSTSCNRRTPRLVRRQTPRLERDGRSYGSAGFIQFGIGTSERERLEDDWGSDGAAESAGCRVSVPAATAAAARAGTRAG